MDIVEREASSTSASIISADNTRDPESNPRNRHSMSVPDSPLQGLPASRVEALFRRMAQEPPSRPTPPVPFGFDSAPGPLDTSTDVPVSPYDGLNGAMDSATSDLDEVRFATPRFFICTLFWPCSTLLDASSVLIRFITNPIDPFLLDITSTGVKEEQKSQKILYQKRGRDNC